MALTRIDNPTPSAPAALADYVQILAVANAAQLQAIRGNSHSCIDFTNNFAREGVVFYVGGVLYKAVTDQAIGGTPSKYVKITPSGATAAIDYVASLAGVSWNDAQSGYYDGSGNLYVFDEARAVYDGVVSAGKTIAGQIAYIPGALNVKAGITMAGALAGSTTGNFSGDLNIGGQAEITDELIIHKSITENGKKLRRTYLSIGAWNMDSTTGVAVSLSGITGIHRQTIIAVDVIIGQDYTGIGEDAIQDWSAIRSLAFDDDGYWSVSISGGLNILLNRTTSGVFDNSNFSRTTLPSAPGSPPYNRGWVALTWIGP